MQDVGQSKIPVCRPLLPDPKSLAPFLERISAARWYSNYGAVYGEFRSGLADLLATDPRHLVLVSNATIGLMLALAARTRGRQGLCKIGRAHV